MAHILRGAVPTQERAFDRATCRPLLVTSHDHGDNFLTHLLVYPVSGGLLAGLVIPHESGFAIALVEKLEDLVSLLFLPVVRLLLARRRNVC